MLVKKWKIKKVPERYVVTIDMYVWATDDKDAIKQAKKTAKVIDNKEDNSCAVVGIIEQPSGTTRNRIVQL